MKILKSGVVYFALVFGSGFVLGVIRTLLIVPRLGARTAELMEMPLMLVVIVFAARWTVKRLEVSPAPSARLGMGAVALALSLIAEVTLTVWLRGLSIHEYLATRDPIAGTVYYLMLGFFAILPLLMALRS